MLDWWACLQLFIAVYNFHSRREKTRYKQYLYNPYLKSQYKSHTPVKMRRNAISET